MFITRHIRLVISFWGLSYIKIALTLKKKHENRDIGPQISSCTFLEAFNNKLKTKNAEVLKFCHNYLEISKKLSEKRKLDKYTKFRWFLKDFLLLYNLNSLTNIMFI